MSADGIAIFIQFVGWVEPRETHHLHKIQLMGIASLNPSYALRSSQ
jgi:hypothetical protein